MSDPIDGTKSCTAPNGENKYGAVCTFTCDTGFYNNGSSSRECKDKNPNDDSKHDGYWTGSSASCKGIGFDTISGGVPCFGL